MLSTRDGVEGRLLLLSNHGMVVDDERSSTLTTLLLNETRYGVSMKKRVRIKIETIQSKDSREKIFPFPSFSPAEHNVLVKGA